MSNKTLRRLKVATELRNLSETNSPVMCFDKVDRYAMGFQALKAVIGKGDLFENLADLIEPDTCVMSFVEEESMVATYRCSNCGRDVVTPALCGYPFPFCPYCGAKVRLVDDSENPARKYGLANQCGQGPAETESCDGHDARHSDRDCCHQSSTGCCRGES